MYESWSISRVAGCCEDTSCIIVDIALLLCASRLDPRVKSTTTAVLTKQTLEKIHISSQVDVARGTVMIISAFVQLVERRMDELLVSSYCCSRYLCTQ